MNLFKIFLTVLIVLNLSSCKDVVEGINENDPNKFESVDGKLLLKGMQLADITAQSGYLNWAASVWTGHFKGSGRFGPIQDYQYVNTNSNTPWRNIYVGVVKQARQLRSGINVTNKNFFYGASKILEAHAVSTAANLFGNVPFSQAGQDKYPTPQFDEQKEVYNQLQALLDEAITDLSSSSSEKGVSEDLFFDGNAKNWIKVAYTLKARLYLDVRDYPKAIVATSKGIASHSESMRYIPPAIVKTGDTNLLNQFFSGSFRKDLNVEKRVGGKVEKTYLLSLIPNRNHAKTNELSRYSYYYKETKDKKGIIKAINLNKGTGGIAAINEPVNQITLQENLLIWAEALIRDKPANFNTALAKLNAHRANLRNGVYFPIKAGAKYKDYVEADFAGGGIENVDASLSKEDALLREIIEERYVTFFADILSFNDMRRMKKDPKALQVPIPFNKGTKHPERFLYPFSEVNTNGANVPQIADIFVKTDINK